MGHPGLPRAQPDGPGALLQGEDRSWYYSRVRIENSNAEGKGAPPAILTARSGGACDKPDDAAWQKSRDRNMKRRILISVATFTFFSLVGPLIRLVFPPAPIPGGHFNSMVNDLVFYAWPTTPLGAGFGVSWQSLVADNICFFAVLGVCVGLFATWPWAVLVIYVATCALLVLEQIWGFRAGFDFFSSCALGLAFLLYGIPFGAVARLFRSSRTTPVSLS